MEHAVQIQVNGESRELGPNMSMTGLIESLGLLPEATAVQINDEIVPRSAYAETVLRDGDVVELVRFVGGG